MEEIGKNLKEAISTKEKIEFPIDEFKEQIIETIETHANSLIIGETGSGKTTRIPVFLHEYFPEHKIAITEPRRMAASSVAKFVSSELGYEIGEGPVGFKTRFEDFSDDSTQINFVTEGILLRKMQIDPLLSDYDIVMVDEAHERSLNTDFLLGLLKNAQKLREENNQKELKIIVCSATLEKEKFLNYFEQPGSIEIPGRMYEVKEFYQKIEPNEYPKEAACIVEQICSNDPEGNILVFMTGEEDINTTIEEINKLKIENSLTIKAYGSMSLKDQEKIFSKTDKRKIIIATNIAETSITIEGIKYVVDSGLIKQKEFDPHTGIESLKIEKHSESGLKQRKGRAGRTQPGIYFGLYEKEDLEFREKFQKPEIKRSCLSDVVLKMKSMGIENVYKFDFIDKPEDSASHKAVESLKILGALDENEKITEIGQKMSELPLKPEFAKMVLEAQKYGCVESVCSVVSILSGIKPIFLRPKEEEFRADLMHHQFKDGQSSDFLAHLKAFRSFINSGFSSMFAEENFLNYRQLMEIQKVYIELIKELKYKDIKIQDIETEQKRLEENINKSIGSGLIENLLKTKGMYSYENLQGTLKDIYIHPSSCIAFYTRENKDYIIGSRITPKKNGGQYISMCLPFKKEWFPEIAPQFLNKKIENSSYNEKTGKFEADIIWELKNSGEVVIKEKDKEILEQSEIEDVLVKYIYDLYNSPFKENRDTIEKLEELNKKTGGKIKFPTLLEFYKEKLVGCKNIEDVEKRKKDLVLNIDEFCSKQLQKEIEKKYPDFVKIKGKFFKIEYGVDYRYDNSEYYRARVIISDKNIFDINESDFDFIGQGINKPQIVFSTGDSIFYQIFDNLDQLKTSFDNERIQDEFKKYVKNYTHKIEYKCKESFPKLENKILLTKNFKGEDIYIYPAYKKEETYNFDKQREDWGFFVTYYLDQSWAQWETKKSLDAKELLDNNNGSILATIRKQNEKYSGDYFSSTPSTNESERSGSVEYYNPFQVNPFSGEMGAKRKQSKEKLQKQQTIQEQKPDLQPKEIEKELVDKQRQESLELLDIYRSLLKNLGKKTNIKLKDEKDFIRNIDEANKKLELDITQSNLGSLIGLTKNLKSYINKLLRDNKIYEGKDILTSEKLIGNFKNLMDIFSNICEELGITKEQIQEQYNFYEDIIRLIINEEKISDNYFFEKLGEYIK